jgi:cell division protease FtsH
MADMLMEFETLDSTDIQEIMSGNWDIERKKSRVKSADELQRKSPPPPPPLPSKEPLQPTQTPEPGLN